MAITYTFTPPTAQITPAYLPETSGLQYLLFRYVKPRTRGVNVYCLSDGTYAQDYPTPENQNTNFPLPYNPSNPSAPFAQWNDTKGNVYFSSLPVYIVNIYYGGHVYTIDEATATKLSDAGYGDRIVANT